MKSAEARNVIRVELKPFGGDTIEPAVQPLDLPRAFEEARRTGKWTLPFPWRCQVCGKEVRNIRTVPFCRAHKAESTERRKRRILTAELSHRWDDALAHWADSPPELKDEPNADKFAYHWPEGPWLLFSRGYPARLPDWIVVHSETGEVRRFVEVSSEDIAEDLKGGYPAPDQEELQARWGDPGPALDPLAVMRTFMGDDPGRVDFASVIRKCDFLVYGLLSDFKDLELDGNCYGGGRRPTEIGSVELGYKLPDERAETPAIWIESKKRRYRATHQEPKDKEHEVESFAETVFLHLGPDRLRKRMFDEDGGWVRLSEFGDPTGFPASVSLSGFPALATAWKWSLPEPLIVTVLENDDSQLAIGSIGVNEEEFGHLLERVGPINDRPAVLERYQRESDRRLEEINRRFEETDKSS